jgi:hypothetical protein
VVKIAIVTKQYTFSTGATIVAAEHNSNFDAIYNDYNGNIDNSNLDAAANIADSKLAQITTYGKVHGSSIVSLASIASAAGSLPINNGGLGADLSTATQGAVPYFAKVGTMSALAAGASGYFLMSIGTTGNPVFSRPAAIFGTWTTAANNSAYAAATDLIVCAYKAGTSGSVDIQGLTDSSNPPTTVVQQMEFNVSGTQSGAVTFPVKKGDYWKVTGATTVRYLPVGI